MQIICSLFSQVNRPSLESINTLIVESRIRVAIREKFNSYDFDDYKEHVIDLLKRVCTVSIETMKIICEMPK